MSAEPTIANETVTINAQDFNNCHARVDEIFDMVANLSDALRVLLMQRASSADREKETLEAVAERLA